MTFDEIMENLTEQERRVIEEYIEDQKDYYYDMGIDIGFDRGFEAASENGY